MNWKDLTEATMRIGLQKDLWKDLGTGFLAPIYSQSDPSAQFIITAYHVVIEPHIKQEQILVLDSNGKFIPASIECCSPPSTWRTGYDFAVLRLHETTSINPLPCAREVHPGSITIRGRPQGLETEFAFVQGHLHGLERRKSELSDILDMTSPDFYNSRIPSSNGENSIAPHDVWRGMSGAPIVLCKDDNENEMLYVIGVFTRLSPGGVAGRAYGVPISVIEASCHSKNLLIDLENPYKTDSRGSLDLEYLALSDLFGGMDDPARERQLWDWISNLFYRGIETDRLLWRLLNFSSSYGLDSCDVAIMHYFYGRLLIKRGKANQARNELYKSLEVANQASSIVKQRLQALSHSRIKTEDMSTDATKRIAGLSSALQEIEEIRDVPDTYIVSELGSLIGGNTTTLFLKADEFTLVNKVNLDQLILKHKNLMRANPIQLAKQDVVNTLLECLCLLWEVRQSSNIVDDLLAISTSGFQQTKRRKNSIFYTQMLCIKAIAYWLSGEYKRSINIFIFVGRMLHLLNINLNHEGISEIFYYLKSTLPQCANMLEMSNQVANVSSLKERIDALILTGLSKQEAMEAEFKVKEWLEAIPNWHMAYEVPDVFFES